MLGAVLGAVLGAMEPVALRAGAEDARQATAPVLGAVLGVNESVSLRVSAWLEVGCVGSSCFLVRRVLNRRDEVSEQHDQ